MTFVAEVITQNSQHYRPTNIRSRYPRNNIGEKIFIVTPDIQDDIYKLHTYNPSMSDNREFYSYAGIQSYDKSVMINKLFRNIKEKSLLNRMGFNNKGLDHVVKKLQDKK